MAAVALFSAVAGLCGPCQTAGPQSPQQQPTWLASLKKDREETLQRINFTGGVFGETSLTWTQGAYIQPQMHPYDRYFYNESSGRYTVARFLDDLRERYGGIDAVLVWPTYTNIGIDDRNRACSGFQPAPLPRVEPSSPSPGMVAALC